MTLVVPMTASAGPVDAGAVALALGVWIVLALVLYVWLALGLSMVFRKAGVESWRAWVPVLNLFTLLELGGYVGWIALAVLIPFGGLVVWVFVVLAAHRVGRSFGYGAGMTVLAALVLPAWASVVGFGPARWLGGMAPRRRTGDAPITARATRPGDTSRRAPAPPQVPPLPPAPAAAAAAYRAAASQAVVPGTAPAGTAASPVAGPGTLPAWPAPPIAAVVHPVDAPPAGPPESGASGAARPTASPSADPAMGGASWSETAPAASPAEDWSRRARRDQAAASAPVAAPSASSVAPLVTVPAEWSAAPGDGSRPDPSPSDGALPLHQPRYSPWSPDQLDDLPDEVSADHTIPGVGAPHAARAAVSAQHLMSEIADDEKTVVVVRRRAAWELVLPLGPPVPITSSCLILGRRPAVDPDRPDAQLVPIVDETRTVSKRHARLELREDGWWIVDLASTNGVVLATADGAEYEIEPGVEHRAGDRFLLGDAEVRIQRGPGA